MYVDDDQALVFLVQRLLRRRGYEVSGFTDPHEAQAALNAAPQRYDLLVTDYNMPGFCGVDLVREARLIRPDLPVALASGYVTAEIEQAALAEGARRWGGGSGASPLVSGHSAAHEAVADTLARWYAPHIAQARAIGFCTGYMANLAVVTA
ncbi:response regulator, partial [Escherichia coli]|uniref:response regulator n=1 Tax=Escherichia coli TaxID=562 RepID=UPI0032671D42